MTLEENGSGRVRPRLPFWIAIVSVIVALLSASVLVYVLYKETKGPGEILREFARRVDRHDCEGSYELLDEGVRTEIGEEVWCTDVLPAVDGQIDSDFDLEQAVLDGDVARLQVSGVAVEDWLLRRFGERSWRVEGPADGGFDVT